MELTKELREEYVQLYNSIEVDSMGAKYVARKISNNQNRYMEVAAHTKIPWYVIGAIHAMEAGLHFTRNLHNGQRWDKKTTIVPKDVGPFSSWEESAVDAMQDLKNKLGFEAWFIPEICFAFEKHNGWGYRKYHSHVNSPYLWSGSNHYTSGKYVADGKWDEDAVSKQVGAMCLIKILMPNLDDKKIEHIPVESKHDKTLCEKIKGFFNG